MEKHFVIFLSPGSLVHEQTTREIESWDVDAATDMADSITERHGATPFGFYFASRARRDDELDSRQVKHSGTYYLGGEVLTLDDVKHQMPDEHVLISNMECNGYDRVIVNTNSWKVTQPFGENDVCLDYAVRKAA